MTATTDVAIQGTTELTTFTPVDMIGPLRTGLEAMDLAQALGEKMCRSPFAPKAFRGNADASAAAILAGMELGMMPGQALRSFDVVEGAAGLTSHAMRALITSAGHHIELRERSAERVTLAGRRRGETTWTEITWTIQDAQRAGLAAKQVWRAYPASMLLARCTTTLAKVKFPDVIAGIPCVEELADLGPVDITAQVEVTRPAERPTAAGILAAAASSSAQGPENMPDNIPADVTPTPAAAPEPEVTRAILPITDSQLRMLGAVMAQLGVAGTGVRERRLAIASRIVDRELTSSKELSKDEASVVLDTLTSILNAADGPARLRELETGEQAPADHVTDEQPDDGYDPTGEASWGGMDGAEAAAEGGQG